MCWWGSGFGPSVRKISTFIRVVTVEGEIQVISLELAFSKIKCNPKSCQLQLEALEMITFRHQGHPPSGGFSFGNLPLGNPK